MPNLLVDNERVTARQIVDSVTYSDNKFSVIKTIRDMQSRGATGEIPIRSHLKLQLFSPNDSFCGHVMVERHGVLMCWGGTFHDTDTYHPSNQLYVLPPQLADTEYNFWIAAECSNGEVPPPRSGAAGVLVNGNRLIVFGGYVREAIAVDPDGFAENWRGKWTNDLYSLDLVRMSWAKYRFTDSMERPTPRDKMCSWEHNGSCYFFGGYGYGLCDQLYRLHTGPFIQTNGLFTQNFHAGTFIDYAWNNQLMVFDGETIRAVPQGGTVPCPRAAAACTKKGGFSYLFGGRNGDDRLNDLYRLDMYSHIWTQIQMEYPPLGRSWSTMNITDTGRLLIWGGLSTLGEACSDLWSAPVYGGKWSSSGNLLTHRYWHTSALVDGCLLVVGGRSTTTDVDRLNDVETEQLQSHMERLQVEPSSLKQLAFQAVPQYAIDNFSIPEPLFSQLRLRSVLSGEVCTPPYLEWFSQLSLPDVLYYGSVTP